MGLQSDACAFTGKEKNPNNILTDCNEINHLVDLSLDFVEMEEGQREDLGICSRLEIGPV